MNKWIQKQKNLLNRFIAKLTNLYEKEYIKTLDEIKGLVLELYAKISVDGKPLLSHLYQFKRYYKLTKDIQDKLTSLGIKQERLFTEELEKYYKANVEILDDQFEIPFETTDKRIKEIVESYLIDNTLWRESIWKDKALLLSKVRHELVMHVASGKTIDQMANTLESLALGKSTDGKRIKKRIATPFYNAKRLIRTEMVKFYTKTTIEKYKEAGVKEVIYHATMDKYNIMTKDGLKEVDRTCEECKRKNGKIFPIDSDQLPPTHPNCRCWITPVIK